MNNSKVIYGLFSCVIVILISTLFYSFFAANTLQNGYKTQNTQLRNSVASMNKQIKQLSDDLKQLEAEKTKLQNENKDYSKQIDILNEKIKTLNNTLISHGLQNFVQIPKTAYLTFDDGPSANTEKVLDTLKLYNIKASFFVIGRTDEHSLKMYKRIVNEGHTICLHTFSHAYNKVYLSDQAFWTDVEKVQTLVQNTTGVKSMYLRFPGGSSNTVSRTYSHGIMTRLVAQTKEKGYHYFDWNVSSGDASTVTLSASTIASNILNTSKNKTEIMVLMHDSAERTTTAEALASVIEGLKNQGYTFSQVTDKTQSFAQRVQN